MGLLEPITHKEEIQELLDNAQTDYDEAITKFKKQKKKTSSDLEKLGELKINAWADSMNGFVDAFSAFKNIEVTKKLDVNIYYKGMDENPEQVLLNIENATLNANEIIKAGVSSLGAGALVGVAAYGGAMMFASASTGTAISALTGAAKTNATLAWFGGGALKAGGLGVAGGKLVLAGIAVAPALIVGSMIANSKGAERLAEAKKISAETHEKIAEIDLITTGMEGIAKLSNNYYSFIKKFNERFKPFIEEVNNIKARYPYQNGKIDFNNLTEVEQKTLHLAWLMAQTFYQTLSTPILTDQGEASSEAGEVLEASEESYDEIKNKTSKMTGEDAHIANLFWQSSEKKMQNINFIVAGALAILGILSFIHLKIMLGLLLVVAAIVAFPGFFEPKEATANQVYKRRLVKLIVSGAIIIVPYLLLFFII